MNNLPNYSPRPYDAICEYVVGPHDPGAVLDVAIRLRKPTEVELMCTLTRLMTILKPAQVTVEFNTNCLNPVHVKYPLDVAGFNAKGIFLNNWPPCLTSLTEIFREFPESDIYVTRPGRDHCLSIYQESATAFPIEEGGG